MVLKFGWLYQIATNKYVVCVGKNLLENNEPINAVVVLSLTDRGLNMGHPVNGIKAGEISGAIMRVLTIARANAMGQFLMTDEDVAKWLTMLKLSGKLQQGMGYPSGYYIGDWTKRKKCPTDRPVAGHYYLREPLVCVRRGTWNLESRDTIWYFKGMENEMYVWHEVLACYAAEYSRGVRYNNDHKCVHKVQKQYSGMVEFHLQEWVMPNQSKLHGFGQTYIESSYI